MIHFGINDLRRLAALPSIPEAQQADNVIISGTSTSAATSVAVFAAA
jgi:hypothetical protein